MELLNGQEIAGNYEHNTRHNKGLQVEDEGEDEENN